MLKPRIHFLHWIKATRTVLAVSKGKKEYVINKKLKIIAPKPVKSRLFLLENSACSLRSPRYLLSPVLLWHHFMFLPLILTVIDN